MKKETKKFLSVILAMVMLLFTTACAASETSISETPSSETSASDTSSTETEATTEEIETNDQGMPVNSDGSKLMEGATLVMSSDNFKPYRYQNESGEWIGYDFAVMDALSEILGFTYEFSEIEFSGVVTSVSTGKSDVAPTLVATEERKEVLDFTEPYHIPKPLFAVQEDSDISSVDDLIGKKVAVTFGTSWETMLNDQLPEATITAMDTLSSVVADVVAGRQDVMFGDSVQITSYAKENDLKTIEWDTDYTVPENNFGFKKGSAYVEYFNKGLEYLKSSGELQKLQEEWLGSESATDWSTVSK